MPSRHTSSVAQACPQLPQCIVDAVRSTQPPVHIAEGASQRHAPRAQVSGGVQASLQAPQLAAFVSRSTQSPPQSTRPPGQPVLAQIPSAQASPSGQGASQDPQCAGEAARLTHAPLQSTFGAAHGRGGRPVSESAVLPHPAAARRTPTPRALQTRLHPLNTITT
jgi:hypothetical protein